MGTTYGLKVGAGMDRRGPRRRTVRSGGLPQRTSDTAVSFSVTQSITPRLSFIGSAEAHRGIAPNTLDPIGGASQVVIGAGIGLRF